MTMTKLDFPQVIKEVYDEANKALRTTGGGGPGGTVQVENVPGENLGVITQNSLVPSEYDQIALTYVAAGNGVGEIETATYSLSGSPVATLTLSYDSSNRLINVVRS